MCVVSVSYDSESTRKLIESRGVTPGRISSGVVRSNNQGNIKVTVGDRNSTSSNTNNDRVDVNQTREEPSVQQVSSTPIRQTPIIGVYDNETKQSRLLTTFEAEAYVTTSGGQSVELNNSTILTNKNTKLPTTKKYLVIKSEYDNNKGGSRYVKYDVPKVNTPDKTVPVNPLPPSTLEAADINKGLSYYAEKFEQSQYKSGVVVPLARAGASTIGFASGFVNAINPVMIYKGVKSLVTDPKGVISNMRTRASESPYVFYGELAGALSAPTVVSKSFSASKNLYIKAGSRYVPPEQVFSKQVMSGDKILPLSTGTYDALSKFKSTGKFDEIYVVSASPGKISGTTAGIGKKASLGLEDPGIYVTPKGEGSPYFLRIADQATTEYSLNPFKDIRSRVGIPTVTEFKASGIKTYPSYVLRQPGFSGVAQYQESVAGSGYVFITKRSQIGQGDIPSYGYPGTTELEAVIPKGQSFSYTPSTIIGRFKSFDEFTVYEGKNVAIRRASLLSNDASVSSGSRIFGTGRVVSETRAVSSAFGRTVTPNYSVVSVSGLLSSPGSVLYSSPVSNVVSNGSLLATASKSYVIPRSSSYSTSSTGGSRSSSSITGDSSSVYSPSSSNGSSSFASTVSRSSISSSSTYGSASYSSYSFTPTISRATNTTRTPFDFSIDSSKSYYDVYVKRYGVYKKYNPEPLSVRGAEILGRRYTELTPSASFKIVNKSTGSPVNPKSILSSIKYRSGKADPLSFVERSAYRINSPGELRGITFEGVRKKRRKSRGLIAL